MSKKISISQIDGLQDALDNVSGGGVTEVTYAELTDLISSGGLAVGSYYLLTDYETTYTQPVSGETKSSGVIEPLILLATSNNQLNTQAKSLLYPQDIIYYTIDDNDGEGFTKGKIFRRVDTIKNNDIGTDWRHIQYRRWKVNVTNEWNSGNDYSKGDIVYDGIDLYIATKDIINSTSLSDGNFIILPFNNLTYVSFVDSYFYISLTNGSYNIPVDELDYQDFTLFDLTYYNGGGIVNNKIEGYTLFNSIFTGSAIANNVISSSFNDNTLLEPFVNNVVSLNFYSNIIKTSWNITYQHDFQNNYISSINRVSFKSGCTHNIISNMYTCNFGLDCTNNVINSGAYSNTFLDGFQYNVIGKWCSVNEIGYEFNYNIIGDYFSSNKIGRSFNNNIIGNYFAQNNVGNDFSLNIIGNDFNNNVILNSFNSMGGVDFSSATYVYLTYPKELYITSLNEHKLIYDKLTIVDATD